MVDTHELTQTPAQILDVILREDGVVSDPALGGDWPARVSNMPDGVGIPNDVVALYDTPGINDGRDMRTGEVFVHHGVEIMVRSLVYLDGWRKIWAAAWAFEKVAMRSVTVGGGVFLVWNITRTTEPASLGTEEGDETEKRPGIRRRELFSANFIVTVRGT